MTHFTPYSSPPYPSAFAEGLLGDEHSAVPRRWTSGAMIAIAGIVAGAGFTTLFTHPGMHASSTDSVTLFGPSGDCPGLTKKTVDTDQVRTA